MAVIFISLSDKDRAWGDWIAWELERAGHEPIYQHWHFRTGQNFLLHMEEAWRKAECVLVILSRSYFESEYVLTELNQALHRDVTGRKGLIVPVLVEKVDFKGSLFGSLAYIDLTDNPDEETARRRLLDGLRLKGRPLVASPFPRTFTQPRGETRFPDAVPATSPGLPTRAPGAPHNHIFISYSHEDVRWLRKIRIALKPLERTNTFEVWDDTSIRPGTKWKSEISTAMNSSDTALLLVSQNFFCVRFYCQQ